MDNHITLLDALLVTIVSMAVVFSVLILISYLITALQILSQDKKEKEESTEPIEPVVQVATVKEVNELAPEIQDEFNEEMVAVIAAAVAANLGLNIPDINIKSIRRVPQLGNSWASAGKREQILGRF